MSCNRSVHMIKTETAGNLKLVESTGDLTLLIFFVPGGEISRTSL